MPRPKKEDKKPVEKPKAKATTKRRKDKEEDHDDLEEFEEKPEKKLKVESQDKGKAKIAILTLLDQTSPGNTSSGTHTFKDLASALEFREGLLRRLEGREDEDDGGVVSGIPYFNKQMGEHVYDGSCEDGPFSIRIKEITVDELLAGEDVNIWQGY